MKLLLVCIGILFSLILYPNLVSAYYDPGAPEVNSSYTLRSVIENLFDKLETQQYKLSVSSRQTPERVCQLVGDLDATLDSLKAALNKYRASATAGSGSNIFFEGQVMNEPFYVYIKQQVEDVSSYSEYVKANINCAKVPKLTLF